MFWEPSEVDIAYSDSACTGFERHNAAVFGQDVGTITVTGGSRVASQTLTRADRGFYHVRDVHAWAPGDEVSLAYEQTTIGPLTVPSRAQSEDLKSTTSISRTSDLTLRYSATNASRAAVVIDGATSERIFLLICVFDASSHQLTIPAAAIASLPADIAEVDVSLVPVNQTQVGDVAFMAGGTEVSVTATVEP